MNCERLTPRPVPEGAEPVLLTKGEYAATAAVTLAVFAALVWAWERR